jgi:hypothetical protein
MPAIRVAHVVRVVRVHDHLCRSCHSCHWFRSCRSCLLCRVVRVVRVVRVSFVCRSCVSIVSSITHFQAPPLPALINLYNEQISMQTKTNTHTHTHTHTHAHTQRTESHTHTHTHIHTVIHPHTSGKKLPRSEFPLICLSWSVVRAALISFAAKMVRPWSFACPRAFLLFQLFRTFRSSSFVKEPTGMLNLCLYLY